MALTLMRRLSTSRASASSLGFITAFGSGNNHSRRFPIGATAAISGGVALYYCLSPTTTAQLDAEVTQNVDKVALDPSKWLEFKLHETARVNHNSLLYRFTFDPAAKLGLDVSSCILTRAPIGEETVEGKRSFVVRPYTPISDPDSKGYFDLLIKIYPDGKMGQHFASLKPGDLLEVKGPIPTLRYSPNMKKKIGMIAGGTGITPMLQVIKAILKNPDDKTQISLLFANISPDDILLKAELDRLAAKYPNFKVYYTVDNPTKNWTGGSGYISEDMIVKGLPGPGDDTLILVCGNPGFMNHISGGKAKDRSQGEVSGLLKQLGYNEDMVYKF